MHAPSAGPWASRDDVADRKRAGGQVGVPHEVKGESIYAFVTLMDGLEMTPALQKELKQVTVARSRLHFSHHPPPARSLSENLKILIQHSPSSFA